MENAGDGSWPRLPGSRDSAPPWENSPGGAAKGVGARSDSEEPWDASVDPPYDNGANCTEGGSSSSSAPPLVAGLIRNAASSEALDAADVPPGGAEGSGNEARAEARPTPRGNVDHADPPCDSGATFTEGASLSGRALPRAPSPVRDSSPASPSHCALPRGPSVTPDVLFPVDDADPPRDSGATFTAGAGLLDRVDRVDRSSPLRRKPSSARDSFPAGWRSSSSTSVREPTYGDDRSSPVRTPARAARSVTGDTALMADDGMASASLQSPERYPRLMQITSRMDIGSASFATSGGSPSAFDKGRSGHVDEHSLHYKIMKPYSRLVAHHPGKVISFYSLLFLTFMLVRLPKWLAFEIETDFSSFIRADGEAVRRNEAYSVASGEKKGIDATRRLMNEEIEGVPLADDPSLRRLKVTKIYMNRKLSFVYVPKDMGVLDQNVLKEIQDFEGRLRSLGAFVELCSAALEGHERYCNPGHSLVTYTWPTTKKVGNSSGAFTMKYDAGGGELLPLPAVFAYMQRYAEDWIPFLSTDVAPTDFSRFFPKDYETPPILGDGPLGVPWPEAMMSTFRFNLELSNGSSSSPQEWQERNVELSEEYHKAITESIWPFVYEECRRAQHVWIYYFGDHILTHEVLMTLRSDALWAIASLGLVLLYLRVHTGNNSVSCMSMTLIFLSIPMAYVMTPMAKANVCMFMSFFVMLGVGSDVVFVYTDFWMQGQETDDTVARVSFTLLHAGRSCFATSVTTAVSFIANLKSTLQALREFGLFMGFCVINVFILVSLFLPPLLVIVERQRKRRKTQAAADTVDVSAGDVRVLAVVPNHGALKEGKMSTEPGPANLTMGQMLLFKLVGIVAMCPIAVLIVTAAIVVSWLAALVATAELQQGDPDIFPEEHNQVQIERWRQEFADTHDKDRSTGAPPASATVCAAETQAGMSQCDLFWCFSSSAQVHDGACWYGPVNSSGGVVPLEAVGSICNSMVVATKLVGLSKPGTNAWRNAWLPAAKDTFFPELATVDSEWFQYYYSYTGYLAMEDWAPGTVSMAAVYPMGSLELAPEQPAGSASCKVDTLCYVGVPACDAPEGWAWMGNIALDDQELHTRRLRQQQQPARQLQDTVPTRFQIGVTVVWGIRAALHTPIVGGIKDIWSYDPSFEPTNPWAQRAIYAMCADPEVQPGAALNVSAVKKCWIYAFRDWLLDNGREFPSRDMATDLFDWWPTQPVLAPSSLWFEQGQLKACKVEFRVDQDTRAAARTILEYKELWDAFVGRMNAEASVTANKAYHTSSTWVTAETEEAIMASTKETIGISAFCGWLGMLLFTHDLLLACVVGLLVVGIIIGLAFFMVVCMGWKIGAIEVIALVVFVGYSITYSLHIAHNYASSTPDDPHALDLENLARRRRETAAAEPSRFPGVAATYFTSISLPGLQPPDAAACRPSNACLACGGRGCDMCADSPVRVEGAAKQVKDACLACGGVGCGMCSGPTKPSPLQGVPMPTSAGEDDEHNISGPLKELPSSLALGSGHSMLYDDMPSPREALGLDDRGLRLMRTRAAVLNVGAAMVSSAGSTVGSSVFLLFCTLNIFGKMGLVVMAVTILSLVFSMVVLPAALMTCGPLGTPWVKRCARWLTKENVARMSREIYRTLWEMVESSADALRRTSPKSRQRAGYREEETGAGQYEDLDHRAAFQTW